MNFRILFGILAAFESIRWSVQARTAQDVINDFEPSFKKIHGEFTQYETNTKLKVEPKFDNITSAILNQNQSFNLTLANVRVFIQQTVWEILEETEMINHQDRIPHCITNLNRSENSLIARALGGQRICVKIALDHSASTSDFVKILFTELGNEHSIVEATREECGKLKNPFDVQECIIKDLYLFYPNYLTDVAKEIERRVSIVDKILTGTVVYFYKCDKFLKEEISEVVSEIFDEFKDCVIQAKP